MGNTPNLHYGRGNPLTHPPPLTRPSAVRGAATRQAAPFVVPRFMMNINQRPYVSCCLHNLPTKVTVKWCRNWNFSTTKYEYKESWVGHVSVGYTYRLAFFHSRTDETNTTKPTKTYTAIIHGFTSKSRKDHSGSSSTAFPVSSV